VNRVEVSGRRLKSWLESTLTRFKHELASDHKLAQDRFIEKEVETNFKQALKEDVIEEERKRKILQAEKEAVALALMKSQEVTERRKNILETLPHEPEADKTKGQEVVTLAVRLLNGDRVNRRFYMHEPTQLLFDWLDAVHHVEVNDLCLKNSDGSILIRYGRGGTISNDLGSQDKRVLLNVNYVTTSVKD
jgi:hypothetical protein